MNLWGRAALAAALLVLLLPGCGQPANTPEPDDGTLTILAADELRDLEPLLGEMAEAAGEPVEMEYAPALQVVDRLVKGDRADLAWLAHSGTLAAYSSAKSPALAQEKIMRSPVVVGVKAGLAEAWGWTQNPNLTWRDIAEHAAAGDLKFAMAPAKDNQVGLSALLGVSASILGRPDALLGSDLPAVTGRLGAFLSGQALEAGAGKLARTYLREQDRLNGIIDYEATLLQLNRGGDLKEALALVYPREGIVTADFPLVLVNPAKRAAYDRLVRFLRSPSFQQKLMDQTLRRPASREVPLSAIFPAQVLVELPYPTRSEALEQLRAVQPGEAADLAPGESLSLLPHERHVIFVVDVSASTRGARLEEIKAALLSALAGVGEGLNRVSILAYHHEIALQSAFEIDPAQPATMQAARGFVAGLQARGGTASYTALKAAYEAALRARKLNPGLPTRVVLVTDGRSTQGMTEDDFLAYFRKAEGVSDISTSAVVLSDGAQQDFAAIAQETGGSTRQAAEGRLGQTLLDLLKEAPPAPPPVLRQAP